MREKLPIFLGVDERVEGQLSILPATKFILFGRPATV